MSTAGAITYVLVLPDPVEPLEPSPFQGFSAELLRCIETTGRLLRLPPSVVELANERDGALMARLRGGSPYQIVPLYVGAVAAVIANPLYPFLCVVSGRETVDDVQRLVDAARRPVLHVTTARRDGIRSLDRLTRDDLLTFCRAVVAFLEERGVRLPMLRLPRTAPPWRTIALPMQASGHPIVAANELALMSAGFDLPEGRNPIPEFDPVSPAQIERMDEPYARVILETLRGFEAARSAHVTRASPRSRLGIEMILSAPAVFPQILANHLNRQPNLPRILRGLLQQKRYRHVLLAPRFQRELATPEGQAAVATRRLELGGYAAGLAVRAASYFAPVVRLPPGINKVRGRLGHLATCIAVPGPHKERKFSRLAREIGRSLEEEIPIPLLDFIRDGEGGVKLVADAPLELLPLGNAPLALRRVVSRVPVTPGDLYMRLMLTAQVLFRTPADLRDVLIIRSFAETDHRKPHLEAAIRSYMERASEGLRIRWRDVNNSNDFVAALNEFAGSVLVFDGHGFHVSADDPGTLTLAEERLDVSTLQNRVRIPPIVVLSACDTARTDLSHATTVNAFLLLGATSVLGSLAPVESRHSANLVARLLFRLAEYLPMFERQASLIQWSEVVTGLLRMSYVTDMLIALRRRQVVQISDADAASVQTRANERINDFDRSWLEETVRSLAAAARIEEAQIEAARQDVAYFTETLQYLHFGWPEDLFIVGSEFGRRRPG